MDFIKEHRIVFLSLLLLTVNQRVVLLLEVHVVAAAHDGSRRYDGHHAVEYAFLVHFNSKLSTISS